MKPLVNRRKQHCGVHGLAVFARSGTKKTRWRCQKCSRVNQRKYAQRVYKVKYQKACYDRSQALLAKGGRCVICKCSKLAVLQFHHRDRNKKSISLGIDQFRESQAVQLSQEFAKCELLCANCHLRLEVGEIALPGQEIINQHQRFALSRESYRTGRQLDCPTHGLSTHNLAGNCRTCLREKLAKRRMTTKDILIKIHGGKCSCCAFSASNAALQFHHLDPADKHFSIGTELPNKGILDLVEESRKCSLLCANCHFEFESGSAQQTPILTFDQHRFEQYCEPYIRKAAAQQRLNNKAACMEILQTPHTLYEFARATGVGVGTARNALRRMEIQHLLITSEAARALRFPATTLDKDKLESLLITNTPQQIAQQYLSTPKYINRLIENFGIEYQHSQTASTPLQDKMELDLLLDQGLSCEEIAGQLGCTSKTVRKWIRHYGLASPRKRGVYRRVVD